MKPLTPQEVIEKRTAHPAVVEIVNNLLVQRFDGNEAKITQEEVVEGLIDKGWVRDRIFDTGILDFEPVFRNAGWIVEYDKPAYNETGRASWKFGKDYSK